jgi:hypothetical protein
MEGWVKLHRKILDNPIVCKDSDHIAVWVYLLLNATHKEQSKVFGGEKIMLQPGQLITGRKVISEKFNISESKVQRILKTFEIEQQIEQQNGNKNRLISILSWHEYQSSEQQVEQQLNNNWTTDEQQLNTNKNVKKERAKEIKKKEYAEFVFMTEDELKKLEDKYGEENAKRMIEVLDNYKGSKGKKYANDYRAILTWVVKEVMGVQAPKQRDKVIEARDRDIAMQQWVNDGNDPDLFVF